MRRPIVVCVRGCRDLGPVLLILVLATLLVAACQQTPAPPPRQVVTVARPVASWEGNGNRTIGFISDSGRFRVTWVARNEQPPGSGTFRLVVHSAVSGRPIQVVADHHGAGSGDANVQDDPRPYNFMIDSANVDWSFTVEEYFAIDADPSSAPKASEQMKEELVSYFAGEKRAALILLMTAVIAITTAIGLVATRSAYVGMAVPLALLGVAELAIGGVLWARTDAQVAALLGQLAVAPGDMARAELARMGPIMRNFAILKIAEILILTAAIVVTYVFRNSDLGFSVAVGFIAQASLLLVFDLFAERRAEHYVELLRIFATTAG